MIGFGVKFEDAKKSFFDRARVLSAADAAALKVLSKFGAFVMRRARSSIKPAPKQEATRLKRGISIDGVSAPGNPPVSHGEGLLRGFIFFSYDSSRRSVVIGPVKLGGKIGNAPEALEKGGQSEAMVGIGKGRKLVRTTIRARPYMVPSFLAELPGVPAMWAGSIK